MDYFSLSGGPSVVNTGTQAIITTIDPLSQEKYNIITGSTIVQKLVVGDPVLYPSDLGSSYAFPVEMGNDGQFLALVEAENRLEWVDGGTSSGDITNGGNVGPVVVGSTDDNLTFIASGNITLGDGPSNSLILNGGITSLHVNDPSPGPIIDLLSSQYSVAYTTSSVNIVRLPLAADNVGRSYVIHHSHGGGPINLTVAPASGDLIDGILSIPIIYGSRIRVSSIGIGGWKII